MTAMRNTTLIPQRKREAMGQRLKTGGSVPLKTGFPDSPLENVKRANGIPGLKKGGKVGCG